MPVQAPAAAARTEPPHRAARRQDTQNLDVAQRSRVRTYAAGQKTRAWTETRRSNYLHPSTRHTPERKINKKRPDPTACPRAPYVRHCLGPEHMPPPHRVLLPCCPLILSIPAAEQATHTPHPYVHHALDSALPHRCGPFHLPAILCKGCGSQYVTGLLRREQSPLQPPAHDSCPRRGAKRGLWSQDRHPWRAQAL